MVMLAGIEFTDAHLKHLQTLSELRKLNLRGTAITDAGLKDLKGLTSLRWICLEGTQVTEEGVKEFQEALPNCKITPSRRR